MKRGGINTELFRIVTDVPDWIKTLPLEDSEHPYFLTNHKDSIRNFLNATTDSLRLVRASDVSRSILDEYDMGELEELRSVVQVVELFRIIPYSNQTDHSAHTLYNFLLGIYLFFSCKQIKEGISVFLKEDVNSAELLKRFLFHWIYVSLLHDVGYIFQGRVNRELRAVDRMFRPQTIKRVMESTDDELKSKVYKQIHDIKIPPFENMNNPENMLSSLCNIQWGSSLGYSSNSFEIFSKYGLKKQNIDGYVLEEYSFQVASSGYDGISEGTVDHAVASGLLLLRYSTFWYWLAKENKFHEIFADYYEGYKIGDVASACLAASAHNIIGVHGKNYRSLEFKNNPLIYLGVLCDELQKWDRFPAGERNLLNLKAFENYCTDSESIIIKGTWDGDKVRFKINNPVLQHNIKESLDRLKEWNNFIKI